MNAVDKIPVYAWCPLKLGLLAILSPFICQIQTIICFPCVDKHSYNDHLPITNSSQLQIVLNFSISSTHVCSYNLLLHIVPEMTKPCISIFL